MSSRQPRGSGVPVSTSRQNEYFVSRDGIDREVISADICRYLGNDALVRPGHYEVCFIPPFAANIYHLVLSTGWHVGMWWYSQRHLAVRLHSPTPPASVGFPLPLRCSTLCHTLEDRTCLG